MKTETGGTRKDKLFSVTLADCDVQLKRGHGNGGQNRNTRDTAVRIVHRASGAVGESQEQRSQHQNKVVAFKRMTETVKFKVWLNREAWIRQGLPSPESAVDEMMRPAHLRVDVKDASGRWIAETDGE
jgi:protein subunit release factor A